MERFTFANQLRGAAALCVVANHLTGVYWSEPLLVAGATFSAVQTGAPPAFSALTAGAWYNLGPFGVALFFLISGFVIPISLERQTAPGFLVGRLFRIFPTYVLALLIELTVVALAARYWHQPFTYRPKLILANLLLVTDIVNAPSIDLVNWTLVVELKFYLLMAALAVPVRRGSLIALLAVAAAIVVVSRFSHDLFVIVPHLGLVLRIFESNALYVLFMLIGVVFSYHVRGRIGSAAAAAAVIVLFALFVYCWPLTFFRGEYPSATFNYGWALLVFSAMYAFRRRVPDSRVADFFAGVSYPLYLVHALVGFTVMKALMVVHVAPLPATCVAFIVIVLLALTLHVTIERPSQAFGKTLAARIFGRRSALTLAARDT